MVMGHFATALVPYQKCRGNPKASFWLFLLAAQFLDFLMLGFMALGVETVTPENFFDASFADMHTNMLYSHNLVPVAIWALGFAVVAYAVLKDATVAMWCFALIIFHELCDLVVGFEHNVTGAHSPAVGMKLYTTAPVAGLLIEAAMCFGLVWWFAKQRDNAGQALSSRGKRGLYLVLVGGTLATMPIATHSVTQLLGR